MYCRSQGGELHLAVQHRHPFIEQFSCLRPQYLYTYGLLFSVQYHFDLTDSLTFCQASVVTFELLGPYRILDSGSFCRFFIHTDAGELRVRKCTPRQKSVIYFSGEMKNSIGEDNASLITGSVGKLILAGDISRRINVLLFCPQAVVHLDAFPSEIYAQTF